MANRGFVLNNSVGSVNLFLWLHYETFQRRSLVAVRYAARAVRVRLFSLQVPKYFEILLPPIDVDGKSRVTFS